VSRSQWGEGRGGSEEKGEEGTQQGREGSKQEGETRGEGEVTEGTDTSASLISQISNPPSVLDCYMQPLVITLKTDLFIYLFFLFLLLSLLVIIPTSIQTEIKVVFLRLGQGRC